MVKLLPNIYLNGTRMTILYTDPGLTLILNQWQNGNETASDEALQRIYATLQDMSRRILRGDALATLETGELVHEALGVFIEKGRTNLEDRAHFFGIIAHLMRQILVQRARKRNAEKRGGSTPDLTFDESAQPCTLYNSKHDISILDLDRAITALSEVSPRQAQIVEVLYIAGLTQREAAELLNISTATIEREWRMAKIFLRKALKE